MGSGQRRTGRVSPTCTGYRQDRLDAVGIADRDAGGDLEDHRAGAGVRRGGGDAEAEMTARLAEEVDDDDGILSAAELTLQELASFAGLAQENMNRAAGWRFLEMGRRAERAINTLRFARQFAYDEATDEDLDVLLTLVDCQITYRSRYLVAPSLAPVRDLAVLDPYNPRSVAFQVQALNEHIASLPALRESGLIERPQRLAVGVQSMRMLPKPASSAPRQCSRWSRICSAGPGVEVFAFGTSLTAPYGRARQPRRVSRARAVHRRCTTGAAARASAPRCSSTTRSTASARCRAARSS